MSEDPAGRTQVPEMPVLIVDDDAGIRATYTKMLERAGYVVSSVNDAIAAFDEIERTSFGAILCDIQMPGLSGTSFFQQLEERLPQVASRVVFLSGFVDQHETQEFLRGTGQPYLAKPAGLNEVLETIGPIVKRSARESGHHRSPTVTEGDLDD